MSESTRRWWRPPRQTVDREDERRVTFLELFYDLVYVVLIAELAHTLAGDVSVGGVGGFAFLFVIVWWAWLNGTLYHELHGHNDLRTHVFTFLQMFAVAAMAVFAHNALGDGSTGFALSYAAFQLILTYLWWQTGVHDPAHRPLSHPYALGYLVSTLCFVASVFVPTPFRFYLWGGAVALSLVLPLNNLRLRRKDPEVRAEVERSMMATTSMVERFGLFTTIVLGEVIAGTIGGVAGVPAITPAVGIVAVLGMLLAIGTWWMAIGTWWIHFDSLSDRLPRQSLPTVVTWLYLHLLMTISIAATGAVILHIVEHSEEPVGAVARWLLVGAVALTLVCVALLMETTRIPDEFRPLYQRGGVVTLVSATVILLLGLASVPILPLLVLVVCLLFVPVVYGIVVWIRLFETEDIAVF